MQVDLDKIKLGYSSLSERIFAGTIVRKGEWRHKIDVTNDFLTCVIQKWEGHSEIIDAGEDKWEITVKKIK